MNKNDIVYKIGDLVEIHTPDKYVYFGILLNAPHLLHPKEQWFSCTFYDIEKMRISNIPCYLDEIKPYL